MKNATKQAFVPMSSDLLNKEITAIGKLGARLNVRIQLAALQAIWYSIKHGDIGFGNRLVMALNNGQRKNSLVAFLEKHGKFEWDKTQKQLVYRKRDELQPESVESITEFWFEAIKAPEPKSIYDFADDVKRLLKRMEKAITDKADIKHVELFDEISHVFGEFQETSNRVALTSDNEVTDEEVEEIGAELAEALTTASRQELKAA